MLTAFVNVLTAILAAWGLGCLLWLAYGSLLVPVGTEETVTVYLSCHGDDAHELEQTLRGLSWLHTAGLLNAEIRIADGNGVTDPFLPIEESSGGNAHNE